MVVKTSDVHALGQKATCMLVRRLVAKAVFEGYEAPLDEMDGAWTDMDVFDALIRGDFER